MALEAVGGMWLHPDRSIYGRRTCTVELVYQEPENSFENLRSRFRQMRSKGVDIWIRIDKAHGQTLPAAGDWNARWSFAQFCRRVAADPEYRNARGLIIGNEPNLRAEGAILPKWVMTVVSGFNTGADDPNNVFQQVRAVNSSIRVLIPAVGPWNAETPGELSSYPPPPSGRQGLMAWEQYQSTLAWCAYHSSSHWTRADVQFAMHTYSNVGWAGATPANEPNVDIRNPNWMNAHYGIRVYDDLMYQIRAQAGGTTPPNLVSEWNSYVEESWPADNYPVGLMRNAVGYIAAKPNVLGFAVFVDDHRVSSAWERTAVTAYNSGNLTQAQRDRLRAWDTDYDALLRNGWSSLPTGPTAQGNDMQPGEVLNPGQAIVSANGRYSFAYQTDCNLVLYGAGTPPWSSGTSGRPAGVCIMQRDGNLVIYVPGPTPVWSSGTWQHPGSRLVMQDDGNVVIYNTSGAAVWATNTSRPTASDPGVSEVPQVR